jgi:microcompartment protein CcmL/EutN
MTDPALALLEVSSIAQGYFLCDAIVKRAPVRFLRTEAVSPGKYLLMFTGDVASVKESYEEALELAEGDLIDALFLPYVHELVLPAIAGQAAADTLDALGIYEVHTVTAGILAADKALKAADIRIIEFRLAKGIGGKAYFTMTGLQTEVEAALDAADEVCEAAGTRVRRVLIPNPHEDFFPVVFKER